MGATAKTEQEMKLTAPMDGLVLSWGPGCVTPAPRNITGSWNILDGLNKNYWLHTITDYLLASQDSF